jgi:terminase small subunit-like protein
MSGLKVTKRVAHAAAGKLCHNLSPANPKGNMMSKVVKESGPTTRYGRQIVYDREIFISICRKMLLGEDLQTICAKPPMPIGQVFLGWVQDHPEARAIYRSVDNFRMDRGLAREVGVITSIAQWEEQVRANCERGWPADWIERKYAPPDWKKLYPLLGRPPVWSTEDLEAYTEMLNGFTEMLQPLDMMELMWTKEAADATWEAARAAREKNSLPEHKYQERLRVLAQLPGRRGAAESTAAKPATALDHSRGLRAGFKHYQGFDIGQSRAFKRRDNALRQIARWRDGLGAKARRLSDKFIAEQALAERYGATQLLADTETDDTGGDAMQAASLLGCAGDAAPPVPLPDEAAEAAPPLASAAEAVEAVPPLHTSEDAAAPLIALAGEGAESCTRPCLSGASQFLADVDADAIADDAIQAASPLASAGDAADAAPPVPLADEAAGAAPSLVSAGVAAEGAPLLRTSDEAVAPPLAAAAEAAEAARALAS